MDQAIIATGLSKLYEQKKAVWGLNLQVPRESIFALIGSNGAGKTTFIKMLLGLVKPTEGEISILGEKIGRTNKPNYKVCFLGDEPQFYGYYQVDQMVDFCRHLYPKWDQGLVNKIFELMEISSKSKIKVLSRGQRAAVGLALALAPRPELLILDEPATQFDPIKKQAFYSLLFQELVSWGGTVFLATHQMAEVERFADYAAFMHQGQILTVRQVDELKVSEKRIRVVFQGAEPPDIAEWPNVVGVERQGQSIFISVSGDLEQLWERLYRYPHFALELLDINLEDVFLEYTTKGRRHS